MSHQSSFYLFGFSPSTFFDPHFSQRFAVPEKRKTSYSAQHNVDKHIINLEAGGGWGGGGGYCHPSGEFTTPTFSIVVLGVDYEFEC